MIIKCGYRTPSCPLSVTTRGVSRGGAPILLTIKRVFFPPWFFFSKICYKNNLKNSHQKQKKNFSGYFYYNRPSNICMSCHNIINLILVIKSISLINITNYMAKAWFFGAGWGFFSIENCLRWFLGAPLLLGKT